MKESDERRRVFIAILYSLQNEKWVIEFASFKKVSTFAPAIQK